MILNTGGNSKSGTYCPKPETKFKEKKGLSKVRKPTGELALFKEIAGERKHICVKCGVKIHTLTVSNFHHEKPKSTHPELRLDKDNIKMHCDSCHYEEHCVPKEKHKVKS